MPSMDAGQNIGADGRTRGGHCTGLVSESNILPTKGMEGRYRGHKGKGNPLRDSGSMLNGNLGVAIQQIIKKRQKKGEKTNGASGKETRILKKTETVTA